MKNENDVLMMDNIISDLGYTGIGDTQSNRKTFLTITLPKLPEEIKNKTFDEITDDSDDLQGEGVTIIIPSNIFDIHTRHQILLRLKFSGHTDTLTEASNLINELYKRGEIQNKQQYQNALNKFCTYQMELPSKLFEKIAFNTRSRIEEHVPIVVDNSLEEEHLSQPMHTNNKQLKNGHNFFKWL